MRDYTNLDRFLDERVWDAHPNYHYDNVINTDIAKRNILRLLDFGLEKGARVLDVGCGDGRDLVVFRELGMEGVGINFLQVDLDKLPEGITGVLGDQSFMPFYNETFDCLYSRHCLEHSIMPYYTLSEYNRVVKPGGMLYIELPAPDQSGALHESNPNHYSVLGQNMWTNLFIGSGFEVIHADSTEFWDADKDELLDKWFHFFLRKVNKPLAGFFRDPKMIEKYSDRFAPTEKL